MGVGPFSSESKNQQTSNNLTGGSQILRRIKNNLQGNSSLIDFSNLKQGAGATLTIQTGVGEEALNSLVGGITAQTENLSGQFKSLIAEQNDTQAGNPKLFAGLLAAAIAAIALIAYFLKK